MPGPAPASPHLLIGFTLAATAALVFLLHSLLSSLAFPFTVALACTLACCVAVKVDELWHPAPKVALAVSERAKLGLSWAGAVAFLFVRYGALFDDWNVRGGGLRRFTGWKESGSLTRDGFLSYKLIVILCTFPALLIDRMVYKTPTSLLPVCALFLFLLGIGITMAQDFELTTWIRHADWMTGLSGWDGLRVVVPWAVGGLLVPVLSEAGAVWAHDWRGRDFASLVAGCALFVAVSWCGIAEAKRFSAVETQMISNTTCLLLMFAPMTSPLYPVQGPIDPALQNIGFGCAGAAILLYLALQSNAPHNGPAAYSNDIALDEGENVPLPTSKSTRKRILRKRILAAAAAITFVIWGFHKIWNRNHLLPSKPGVMPLCLIATWAGPKLPALSHAFIRSLSPSGGQVRLNLFVDGALPSDLPSSTVAPYLNVVTLDSINSSYATRRWSGFISDRVCTYLGSPIGSAACNATEAALEIGARDTRYPPIMHFRGMYGRLFEEWVGPDHCDSWGWVDTDMIMGDVVGWLASSIQYRDADITTFSNLFRNSGPLSLSTRGQLTIHNQRRVPHIVNELWRGCELLGSLENITHTFTNNEAIGIDEGCYSNAAFTSPDVVIAVLPWQAADFEIWDYGLVVGARLFVAHGCKDPDAITETARYARCRILAHTAAARVDPHAHGPALALSPPPTILPAKVTWPNCIWWLKEKHQTCLAVDYDVQALIEAGKAAFAVIADRASTYSLTVSKRLHHTPADGGYGLSGGVAASDGKGGSAHEMMFYHAQVWKKSMVVDLGDDLHDLEGYEFGETFLAPADMSVITTLPSEAGPLWG
ncbi:hypothetical protein BDK51DRAFT_32164, partial [Blyttiomyces helicus]